MSINDDTPGTNFPHKFCFFSWPGTGCFFQRANQPGCAPRGCPAPQYSNQPPTAGRTASVAKTEGDACVSRPALSVVALAPHRFYCKRCHVNTHTTRSTWFDPDNVFAISSTILLCIPFFLCSAASGTGSSADAGGMSVSSKSLVSYGDSTKK